MQGIHLILARTIIKDVSKKELSGVLAVVYEKEIVRVFVHDAEKISWVLQYLEEQQIPIKEFQVSGIAGDKVTSARS